MPIRDKDLTRVASSFGMRIHPFYKVLKMHTGMDFTAPTGTEIFATGNGVVIEVKSAQRGYGNHVIIDHGFGFSTLYAHMSKIDVRKGQRVKRGMVIGYVGKWYIGCTTSALRGTKKWSTC
jgi:murein DD-endopeptidase MepM/ murein hydrolase activator NlpD